LVVASAAVQGLFDPDFATKRPLWEPKILEHNRGACGRCSQRDRLRGIWSGRGRWGAGVSRQSIRRPRTSSSYSSCSSGLHDGGRLFSGDMRKKWPELFRRGRSSAFNAGPRRARAAHARGGTFAINYYRQVIALRGRSGFYFFVMACGRPCGNFGGGLSRVSLAPSWLGRKA